MRRRTLLVLSAVVVGVTLFVSSLVIRQRPAVERAIQTEASVTPVERAPTTAASPTRREEARLQPEERKKAIAEAIEKTNVPIHFWGKVMDQGQQPIEGVRVQYSYSTEHGNTLGIAWGRQKIHKSETTTDAVGIFTVSGLKGHTLTIESLTKEGYSHTSRGAYVYNYYGDNASGKFQPDQANPILFVMVNKSVAEPLVSHGGTFGTTIRLPGNGTPVRWNIWRGQADPNGELQITFKREPAVLARVGDSAAWSARVAIVGGGIVQASPGEPFHRAPEEGYVLELDYPKIEQKRGVPARCFYIKTAEGKYGRIELDLYADDEGPTARCLVKTTMNPSGSRVLESAQ